MRKKLNSLPFWCKIACLLLCSVALSIALFFAVFHNQKEKQIPCYNVTFAYQDGTVIETKTVKQGYGVLPPILESDGIFRGWSGGINNVQSDTEVHPVLYSGNDENLISIPSVYVVEGEKFEADLVLTGEVRLSEADLTITYDSEVLQFLQSEDGACCQITKVEDGTLQVSVKSENNLTEREILSTLQFKALKKDVYSTDIEIACGKNAKTSDGNSATVSTLNNSIFYLQEVE